MSQTGVEIDDRTLKAWADITMGVWFQRQSVLGFSLDDGHLMDSMPEDAFIEKKHGGQAASISFEFFTYGRYVDMGVGREYFKGNCGDVESVRKRREPKEWFYRNWYREVMRLKEIMAGKYKNLARNDVFRAVDDMFSNPLKTGKGTHYTDKQRIRNARNYALRRTQAGYWADSKGKPRVWTPYDSYWRYKLDKNYSYR